MKNVIIILFTIILAIHIGSTYILGEGGTHTSFSEVADGVADKSTKELKKITDFSATSSPSGQGSGQ
tara:strand:- start:316 stop:516 length:201 start_codon:yes stop_codon:yes gene_type:complete